MKKLLIPIIFILIAQVTFGQIVGTPLPWKVKGYGGSGKVDSSVYSTKANVNHVADSVLSLVPAQFNPIAGTNITLSGTYPNITFNSTGGTGTVTYVKPGYGINVDSSAGNKYTASADTSSTHGLVSKDRLANLSDSVGLYFPLRKDSTGKNQYIDTLNLHELRYSLANRDTTKWTDTTLIDRKFLTARINAIPSGGTGTVTSVTAGFSMTGGTITTSGTVAVDTSTAHGAASKDYLNNALSLYFKLPALTSGSVLFSNGTTIAQDNSNYFWDNTNKRLGIGTNTPTKTLHVVGDALIGANTTYPLKIGSNGTVGGFIAGNSAGFSFASGTTVVPTDGGANVTNGYINFGSSSYRFLGVYSVGGDFSGSVITAQYKLSALNTAPASSTSTGTLGEIRVTASYIYICTATNTWVRAALTTF